jgi:hypothetical protein
VIDGEVDVAIVGTRMLFVRWHFLRNDRIGCAGSGILRGRAEEVHAGERGCERRACVGAGERFRTPGGRLPSEFF